MYIVRHVTTIQWGKILESLTITILFYGNIKHDSIFIKFDPCYTVKLLNAYCKNRIGNCVGIHECTNMHYISRTTRTGTYIHISRNTVFNYCT